jgi:UDP-4-amino-4,6-dideoxy-N-acetyl-beta-L-altrosamine N-acetyltransferase
VLPAPAIAIAPAVAAAPVTALRPARAGDADMVLGWRNHPDVRRVMFTDHLIAAQEHAAWWTRVQSSPDHEVLIVVHDGRDCGVVTFSRRADEPDVWTWAFYLDPDAFTQPMQQLRAWSGMEQQSLLLAQHELRARRVECEVFSFNAAVLALHKRHRFIERDRYERERGSESLEVVRLYREFT